jgi:predicted nuclease of predicted toxin-antitoxin system
VKICADENISPRLVEIVNDLSIGSPPLLHVSEIGSLGVKDSIWVRTFAEQDGNAILTADANMSRRQSELIAIGETGLKLVILPTQYQQGGIRLQAAYMLLWWPKVLEVVQQGAEGCVLKLPALTLPRVPSWEKIDVQAARQRLSKSTRPSRQNTSDRQFPL